MMLYKSAQQWAFRKWHRNCN